MRFATLATSALSRRTQHFFRPANPIRLCYGSTLSGGCAHMDQPPERRKGSDKWRPRLVPMGGAEARGVAYSESVTL